MSKDSILYKSGDLFLPKPIRDILDYTFIGDVDKSLYINGWSLLHMLSGFIIAYLLFNTTNLLLKSFLIHTLWELWQIYIGMAHPFAITGHSSIVDTIVDTIFFMCGALLMKNALSTK